MRSAFMQVVPITKNVRLSVRIVHTYKLFVRSDLLSNPALSVYAGSPSNKLCFEKSMIRFYWFLGKDKKGKNKSKSSEIS